MAQDTLFGKPGHGAPTNDIRKKKFTEYQFDTMAKQAFDLALEENDRPDRHYGGGGMENHRYVNVKFREIHFMEKSYF